MTLKQQTRRAARNSIFGGMLIGLLAFASFAWACTPAASIDSSLRIGRPGEQVTVTGTNFSAGAPVEIRWNGETGALLGNATGPSFSVPVNVPSDATADVHFIVALQRNLDADQKGMGFSGKTQATFQVTSGGKNASSAAAGPTADLWRGFRSGSDPTASSAQTLTDQSSSPRSPGLGLGMAFVVAGATGTLFCLIGIGLGKKRQTSPPNHKN